MLRYQPIMMNVTEAMLEIYTQTLLTNFSPESWKIAWASLLFEASGAGVEYLSVV